MKKFLSLLLALCLCVGLLPVAAMAEGETNYWSESADTSWYSDTSAASYTISTAAQLAGLAQLVNAGNTFENKTIVLGEDIDLNDKEWTPIGNGKRSDRSFTGNAFQGTFDGNSKTISGLTIKTCSDPNNAIGLFGVVNGGTIKSLTLTGVSIDVKLSSNGGGNTGAAIGLMVNNAKADHITVSGAVKSSDGAGGIVGRMTIEGEITNCTNHAEISSAKKAGGIVGAAYYSAANKEMTISKCSNTGAVTSDAGYVGGIAGLSAANMSECSNSADISGNGTCIGGIVGEQQSFGSVSGCANTGDVKNSSNSNTAYGNGGIVGWARYNSEAANYPRKAIISVTNNINSGKVSGGYDAGGIVGAAYHAITVSGNENYASILSATEFAAGIVGNFQSLVNKEDDKPKQGNSTDNVTIPENKLVCTNNISTTSLTDITAGCKDAYVYDNTSNPHENNAGSWAAQIGKNKYATLAAAIADANGDTVKLLSNVTLTEMIIVDKVVTLDLNGKTITAANDWKYESCGAPYNEEGKNDKTDSMLVVICGAKLTINDSSADKTGTITTGTAVKAYSAIKLTTGSLNDTNKLAELKVNGGTIIGNYYGITGNGSRPNTKLTINGGTIKGQVNDDNVGVYHPQGGELIITGGTIEGATGLVVKSGSVTITGGTFKGEGTAKSYKYNGSGFESTGDGLHIEDCGYPGGAPVVSITGGTFSSEKSKKIGFYQYDTNQKKLADTKTDNEYLVDTLNSGFYLNEQGVVVRDADDLTWLLPVLGALDREPFDDVTTRDWFYDDVSYVNEYGLMTGTGYRTFSPNAAVTRGMVMTILARREGIRTDRYSPWYAAGVEWAKAVGVSDGTSPEAAITREQLATMLYRYASLKGYDLSGAALTGFIDASSVSGYAVPALRWAVGTGLISGAAGVDAGKLLPAATATRAQLAAILHRFFG